MIRYAELPWRIFRRFNLQTEGISDFNRNVILDNR